MQESNFSRMGNICLRRIKVAHPTWLGDMIRNSRNHDSCRRRDKAAMATARRPCHAGIIGGNMPVVMQLLLVLFLEILPFYNPFQ